MIEVTEGIKAAGGIIGRVADLVDDLHTSEEERERIRLEVAKLDNRLLEGQQEINKVEASHASLFVAGWRPMIGWIGAAALVWQFILQPITEAVLAITGVDAVLPKIDYQPLFTLIMGMLGVGAMRSFDKMKGVDTKMVGISTEVMKMNNKEKKKAGNEIWGEY